MREVTVAVVQMSPRLGEAEDNLVKMSEMIARVAASQKVDLIVFPELVTSGNELGLRFTDLAQRVPGPTINMIAQRANEYGVYVAFGMVTKERVESVLYNSAILIGPEGDLVDVYNKVHLRGEERMAFREGFKLPIIETEIGTLGLMIGYDLSFPEAARSLVLDGAEIICVLANWEASQVDEWKTFLRARAYENAVYMVGANRAGEDVTLIFGGESMIVGPRGEIHASMAGETDEESGAPKDGYIVARIDLDEVRKNREEYQMIQNRQPTVYKTLVRRY
jgi:predicted amidohydrolase